MANELFTVREIVSEAVKLLGLEGKFDIADVHDADTAFFVSLLGVVSRGVAYRLPLTATETVTSDASGRIEYSVLTKPYVRTVAFRKGREDAAVHQMTTHLLTNANLTGELTYVWSPETLSADGELPFCAAHCSRNVFVYALCSEYCFVEGMFDESSRWRTKYAQELYDTAPRRASQMTAREWL